MGLADDVLYQQFSYSVCNALNASAVGLLALLPLLVVDAESFLLNGFVVLAMHDNHRSLGKHLGHRVGVLRAPMLNDFVLVTGSDSEILVVHQRVGRHADNEETGGTQDHHQGVRARIREEGLFEAVIVHFL
jgi:hypothetical protein